MCNIHVNGIVCDTDTLGLSEEVRQHRWNIWKYNGQELSKP